MSRLLVITLFLTSIISLSQEITPMMERVYKLNEICSAPDKQVGSFDIDSMPSLPIGICKEISQKKLIIAIDSAYWLPDGAYFSAYMAMEMPGANQMLAFAAKDIKFNPKGIIGGEQSKLMLVSKHVIEMGPNTKLYLPDDGSNYVSWSCNGFESVNLHGYFLFEDGIISPPENSADSAVTAEFEVTIDDPQNMMAMVDFSPFQVKGMSDFQFNVTEAYVDMSDFQNPLNVTLPACYQPDDGGDISLWRGFYLKNFTVVLPEELNKSDQPITLYAQNMFIDDAGVTGEFGATYLFSTAENSMNSEWGFSVDSLMVGLTLNKITKGRMKGEVIVPPLDNNSMEYTAMVTQNDANGLVGFQFTISPTADVSMNCFNSTLTLNQSSIFEINRVNRKFKPKLTLHGNWNLNNPNWNFQGIGFEHFTVISESPYVTQGIFALISEEPIKVANFPVSLNNLEFGIVSGDVSIGADLAFNLGDEDKPSFSAETSVKVISNINRNPSTNKIQWQYDRVTVSSINLAVMTSVVELVGVINFHDNDPVYGKGFYGGINFKIPSIMDNTMAMACAFGSVGEGENKYRYWMVDATLPVVIPVGAFTLTSISGGIAYHMINTKSQTDLINNVSETASSNTLSNTYVPDKNAGLFFRAGVGFKMSAKEETLNGDVMFSVSFNSNGGLSEIIFSGDGYTMCKRSERSSSANYGKGSIFISYDNQEKVLNAQATVVATFNGALTANIWSQFYFSPNLWYVHLGKPSNQCSVNLLNLATANGYFMIGQNLEPMPPPPPQVSSVIGGMSNQRNTESIASGNGIGCGMNLSASFSKTINLTENIYLYGSGSAGLGFDMTLYKYASTTHCEGSSGSFGANYWYLQGQLYAYAGLNIGGGWNDQTVTILSASMAMLLQAKMPKPSYVYGGVNVQANLFGLLEVNRTFDFSFGTDCVVVN